VSRAVRFWKLEGAGNDFLGFDGRKGGLGLTRERIAFWCDRRRGAGADGVLVVEKPRGRGADFRMRYYNADGGEAEMCGNGARCFALLVRAAAGWRGKAMRVETKAGPVQLEILGKEVKVSMSDPGWPRLGKEITAAGRRVKLDCIHTGVPHAVEFVRSVDVVDVEKNGRAIRFHNFFAPAGTNVNFVEVGRGNRIEVRTYERGVEGETLACGTGVVASSILAYLQKRVKPPVHVKTRGGDVLRVHFQWVNDRARHVVLQGPARIVFEGVWHV
jgi:diaminopimelate epimerase